MNDKVVLITGASSGIGARTALVFAKEGAKIAITYKGNRSGVEETAKGIEDLGGDVLIIQADLTSESDAKDAIERVMERYGRLDILVNNAGRYIDGDEWDGDSEIWVRSLNQNLVSVMNISKHAIPHFQKQKSGIIVNISSRYSDYGQYDALAYSAAKAGIVNLTQSYAKLLAPLGRANAISPGAVNTGYWLRAPEEELEKTLSEIPLGMLAEPDDIAQMALFLSSDKAKYITGQNIFVDGGFGLK
ncbi:MAG: SDR family oxidoreductase [Candidatus Gracilibacteria bacterium]|nr:SDR family oxidoreductase [Candidatus Gracilibacteria bacterium]